MRKFSLRNIGNLFKTTVSKWWERDPFRQGAIIAYNSIFALPGLLVVVITLAGYFLGDEVISGYLHEQISSAMGDDTADQVQKMVLSSMRVKESPIAAIIGIVTILIGATGVFVEFQKSLNIIWEVKAEKKKSGIWKLLRMRLFSFGLIISIAFLLLISLVVTSALSAFSSWIRQYWSESLLIVFRILNIVISLGIITLLFALMFKFLPDAKIKWNSVWIGAFLTSLLFVLGKTAIGLYFGKADPASVYGAAGSVVLILLWTAYSSMIVFLGAEFTKVYSDKKFGQVAPADHAEVEKGRLK